MSKKLQVLYEEYKKSQGYADGGKVKKDDDSPLEQVQENVRNDFNISSLKPHEETREERNARIRKENTERFSGQRADYQGFSEGGKIPHNKKNLEELKKAFAKFINEEGSEKGYADGGEVDGQSEDQVALSPEQFQQHLQDLQAQGKTLTGIEGDPQNINVQLPQQTSKPSPASMQDLQEPQSANDKQLENDYQNEDFVANEKASEKQPDESAYSRLLSSINPNKMPKKDDSEEQSSEDIEQPEKQLTPLQEAQNKRDRNIAIQGILRGTALIGSGIAGTNPDQILKSLDAREKYVGMPVQEYQEQIQNQQFDPNSKMSETVKEYLSAKGFKVPEGSSAADLFKIAPFLQKDQALQASIQKTVMGLNVKQSEGEKNRTLKNDIESRKNALYGNRTEAMKQTKEQSLGDKQSKDIDNDFTKLEKRLTAETGSSRSAFGKSANVIRSAEAAQALIDQVPDGNLDNRQIKELARSLDSMLSNGASTVTGSAGLVPSTASGDASKIEEYLTSIPKGAGQQAFVKRLQDTVQREKQIAGKQINATQNKVLSAYSHLKQKAPERYDDMMKVYGIQPMVQDKGKQPASDTSHPQDSQAVIWAKANPGDARAEAILKANGIQ